MRTISTLVLSTTLLIPSLLPSQSPLFVFKGQTHGEQLGYSICPALDVNQDGNGDLLAGSWSWSGGTGRAYLYSGHTGTTLFTFTGENVGDRFGVSVSPASDVNSDGYPDLIVGANNWDDANKLNCGRLYMYSGKDGGLLQTQEGEIASDSFAGGVSSAADVNLDGHSDYLSGAFGWDGPGGANYGRMYLYSGKDHTLLSTYQPESASTNLGITVSSASDVNQDGYPDLVAGANGWDDPLGPKSNCGRIYVFSGKDHGLLFAYHAEQAGTLLGLSISPASDLNLDGYPDILTGGYSWDDLNIGLDTAHGRVYAISSQGTLLFTVNGENEGDNFGYSVSGGYDLNQDGYPDFLAGSWSWYSADVRGRLYLYSGKDQVLLWSQNGENPNDSFGRSTTLLPDLNQDGTPDLAVGANLWDNPMNPTPGPDTNEGNVYLYSGKPQSLASDEHLLSISMASTQALSLDAGVSNAGRMYWVFGNFLVNGTTPGVTLGSVNIPLNPDPWTQLTIDFANTAALSMTKGTLDGNGQAASALNSLAPQPAAPLGLTLQHCYLVYQSGPPDQYYMASNLVPWTTVP